MDDTNASTSPETGLSISTATDRIKQMLAGGNPENEAAGQGPGADADEEQSPEATTETEEQPEEVDASGDATAEDQEGDAEGEVESPDEGEAAKPQQRFKVKVQGEEVEVDLNELTQGYSRTQDYTRKTQQLAAEAKARAAEFAEVQRERAAYAQLLPALEAQLKQAAPRAPDPNLRQLDPGEYAAQLTEWQVHQQKLQAVQAEQSRVMQEAETHRRRYQAQSLQAETEKILRFIPEWEDGEVAGRDKAAIRQYAKDALGLSDEDLDAAGASAAAVTALRKAMLYDALVAKGQAAKPVAKPAPKGVAQPNPSTSTSAPAQRRVSDLTRAKQTLAKTGKVADAAAAIKHLLAG